MKVILLIPLMALSTFAQQGMIRRRRATEFDADVWKEESKSDTRNIFNDRRSPSLSETGQDGEKALREFWERVLMVQPLDAGSFSMSMSMPTGHHAHEKAWPRRPASSTDVNEIDTSREQHNRRLLVVDNASVEVSPSQHDRNHVNAFGNRQ